MILDRPRRVERTGDDRPAGTLARYVRRMSGWHQAVLALIALAVAALGLVPIELQRRIVDDAIAGRDAELLGWLGALYLAGILALRAMRAALAIGQGWLSESAIRYTRGHLAELLARRRDAEADGVADGAADGRGRAVSVLGAEVDRLGSYVGEVPSEALAHLATLLAVIAYMVAVEPEVAGIGIALLVPQIVLVPLMQRRLNRLTARHLGQLRALGDEVAGIGTTGGGSVESGIGPRLLGLYRTRMRIHVWKALMKALLGIASHLATLGILVWGGFMVIEGATTLGVVVAFASGFERLATPARELVKLYRRTEQAAVQHRMIADWMGNEASPGR